MEDFHAKKVLLIFAGTGVSASKMRESFEEESFHNKYFRQMAPLFAEESHSAMYLVPNAKQLGDILRFLPPKDIGFLAKCHKILLIPFYFL